MDRNGYSDSLFDTHFGECFVLQRLGLDPRVSDTVRHEIFQGNTRSESKEDGLWINLSPEYHERWHSGEIEDFKRRLQEEAEIRWLMDDWSRTVKDFVDRYGKNYIGIYEGSKYAWND